MELVEIKQELTKMEARINDFRGSLDLEASKQRVSELESEMTVEGFWDNQKEAQKVIDETNAIKSSIESFEKMEDRFDNVEVLYELVKEENDQDLYSELDQEVSLLRNDLNDFELEMLLSEPYDANNAILELHPGAGGTESQDWASLLLRMYQRWAEQKNYTVETLNYLPGDEAGVKSVTLLIKGHNAYGYLKAEKGVHRLVRISPFDSSGRRHTSFVSCDVSPEIEDDIDIEIRTEDLKIDTYRSSGAGGQHVNVTDSAVRITHLPTNIIVTCQSGRSQIKNREDAMKMLKSKLYQLEIEKQREELSEIRGEQKEIGWGSQIRSYIFHPYSMIKDHRTGLDIGNVQNVMDGDIDPLIDAYLRSQISD
ncbi:MAG TPA: peptide chain release factor 2 [Candidatus Dormibacteraeota bacterium]|nr:peptide chain release factor 2 [Candidatus Dormibacteraeota bacterium]